MEDIIKFLQTLKRFVKQDDFRIEARNFPDIRALGLNIEGVAITLTSLTVKNYSEGPLLDDKDREGDIWIFGSDVCGVMVYIKIRLLTNDALCISFHPAKYEMSFPYQ